MVKIVIALFVTMMTFFGMFRPVFPLEGNTDNATPPLLESSRARGRAVGVTRMVKSVIALCVTMMTFLGMDAVPALEHSLLATLCMGGHQARVQAFELVILSREECNLVNPLRKVGYL